MQIPGERGRAGRAQAIAVLRKTFSSSILPWQNYSHLFPEPEDWVNSPEANPRSASWDQEPGRRAGRLLPCRKQPCSWPRAVLNNAGQPFVSATLTLQEEQSPAAFQDINNSAKGWVSSGRLGWPAGTRDALSGPMWANRATQQESSTWATGPK